MIHPQECISREPDSSECKRAFPLPIPKTSADDQKKSRCQHTPVLRETHDLKSAITLRIGLEPSKAHKKCK
jgi:hypothetical protein